MLGAIVILLTIILFLLFFLERRTMFSGGIFLCWAILSIVFIIITLESYEKHIAIIFASIVFIPIILLFPFYFASFVILLITSGVQLIKREEGNFAIPYLLRSGCSLLCGQLFLHFSLYRQELISFGWEYI